MVLLDYIMVNQLLSDEAHSLFQLLRKTLILMLVQYAVREAVKVERYCVVFYVRKKKKEEQLMRLYRKNC